MVTRELLLALERVRVAFGADQIAVTDVGFIIGFASDRMLLAVCGAHGVEPKAVSNATHTWLSATIVVGDEQVFVFGPHQERVPLNDSTARAVTAATKALNEVTP